MTEIPERPNRSELEFTKAPRGGLLLVMVGIVALTVWSVTVNGPVRGLIYQTAGVLIGAGLAQIWHLVHR